MIKNSRDYLNFIKTPDWELEGKYDIPVLEAFDPDEAEDIQFVEFNEAHRLDGAERKKVYVEFFLYDFLIERTWSRADSTLEFIKTFKGALAPDFSRYTDMPLSMQIWNCYRKMWVARYWQEAGVKVIPTAGWSDERSYEFCFDGMPKDSLIAVSTLGTQNDSEAIRLFRKGYEEMVARLNPKKVLLYGKLPEFISENDVIHIPHIRDELFSGIRAYKQFKRQVERDGKVSVDVSY